MPGLGGGGVGGSSAGARSGRSEYPFGVLWQGGRYPGVSLCRSRRLRSTPGYFSPAFGLRERGGRGLRRETSSTAWASCLMCSGWSAAAPDDSTPSFG